MLEVDFSKNSHEMWPQSFLSGRNKPTSPQKIVLEILVGVKMSMLSRDPRNQLSFLQRLGCIM